MTGEKNRFTTSEKLWNLDDKQLKTPKHDEMVLWLLNKDNLKKLGIVEHDFDELLNKYPEMKEYVVLHKQNSILSEIPLKGHNGFINGYIDLIFSNYIMLNRPWSEQFKSYSKTKLGSEYIIEVKPYIDSFGAVLRQLNSYKSFYGTSEIQRNGVEYFTKKYCLFTLDTHFDEAFESQGITMLHPPKKGD